MFFADCLPLSKIIHNYLSKFNIYQPTAVYVALKEYLRATKFYSA
jgi:hypothetical protein